MHWRGLAAAQTRLRRAEWSSPTEHCFRLDEKPEGEGTKVGGAASDSLGISIATLAARKGEEVNLNVTARTTGLPCTILVVEIIAPGSYGNVAFRQPFSELAIELGDAITVLPFACNQAEETD